MTNWQINLAINNDNSTITPILRKFSIFCKFKLKKLNNYSLKTVIFKTTKNILKKSKFRYLFIVKVKKESVFWPVK